MSSLLVHNARLMTLGEGSVPRRGHEMKQAGLIETGWMLVRDHLIEDIGSDSPPSGITNSVDRAIDAEGRVVLPAFVDCHTHACWAGDRFDEFEMKLAGASYLDILKAGGGIMSTVRAVRSATQEELTKRLLINLSRMRSLGTATVEVKSGYGLEVETELKMLRAIRAAQGRAKLNVVPTFLGAHAIDPENPRCVEGILHEALPRVVEEFHGIACDAYCEEGAWSLTDCRRLFEEAESMGCPIRVHADQFHSLGMTRLAVEMGARSVDHLEAVTPADVESLARSSTIGVLLPCTGFQLDERYAPARAIIDAGGAVAIATNDNPGSAPTPSMPFVIALACRKLGLTPIEAITAATINPACVLGLQGEVGSLEIGKRADAQILDSIDERELAYEIASCGPAMMLIGGEIVHERIIDH